MYRTNDVMSVSYTHLDVYKRQVWHTGRVARQYGAHIHHRCRACWTGVMVSAQPANDDDEAEYKQFYLLFYNILYIK